MSMSSTLGSYLEARGTPYRTVPHPPAASSQEAASAAEVPGDCLAKAVVVEDRKHYLVVVVPATRHVDLASVRERLGRQCGLATEQEIEEVFTDCDPGALPAPAQAFGLDVLVDDRLAGLDEVYFRSGDPGELVRMAGRDFADLMDGAAHGHFVTVAG